MTQEEHLSECKKLVEFNSKYPIGSEFEWYSSDGKIKQLTVRSLESARLDANGLAFVRCEVLGLCDCKPKIFLNQLKPKSEEK